MSSKQQEAVTTMRYGFPTLYEKAMKQAGIAKPADIKHSHQASAIIGPIKQEVENSSGGRWSWSYWTKQTVCAQALYEAGGTSKQHVDLAVKKLEPSLGKIKALKFGRNVGGSRQPWNLDLPQEKAQAIEALRKQISAVKADVAAALEGSEQEIDPEEIEKQKQEEEKKKLPKHERDAREWLEWIQDKVRPWFAARKADGHPIDEWGMRQALDGIKMLNQKIPLAALKHSSTLHLPPEARKALGVKDYDVGTFKPDDRVEGAHNALPYVKALIAAGVNVCLVGGKGVGKTHFVDTLGMIYERDVTAISLSGASSPSDFYGIQKIGGNGGIIEAEFSQLLRKPSFILADEMDAADENMLLMLNRALANRKFYNRLLGETIDVHGDCTFVAAMNTMGLGGGRDFTGRNKLDAASLDRWSMGRVKIDLDPKLETKLALDLLATKK